MYIGFRVKPQLGAAIQSELSQSGENISEFARSALRFYLRKRQKERELQESKEFENALQSAH